MVIYQITNSINDKVYIGQTKQSIDERWAQHLRDAKKLTKKSMLVHRAMAKYGAEHFKIEVLAECENQWYLDVFEALYIQVRNTLSPNGYNVRVGGNKTTFSEDLREKLSIRQRERWTDETRAEWSRSRTGKASAKQRAAAREVMTSWNKSAAGRAKALAANKGRKKSRESVEKQAEKLRKELTLRSPSGDLVHIRGIRRFCRENDLKRSGINSLRRGVVWHYKGWTLPSTNLAALTNGVHDKDSLKELQDDRLRKELTLRDPDGNLVRIRGINRFCRDNGLNSSGISGLIKGRLRKYKGWTLP